MLGKVDKMLNKYENDNYFFRCFYNHTRMDDFVCGLTLFSPSDPAAARALAAKCLNVECLCILLSIPTTSSCYCPTAKLGTWDSLHQSPGKAQPSPVLMPPGSTR